MRQLKRWPDAMLPYEGETVRNVVDEVNFLEDQTAAHKGQIEELRRTRPVDDEERNALREKQMSYFVAMRMNGLASLRNKRALLLYHRHRLQNVRSMAWELGNSISTSTVSSDPNSGIIPVHVKKHLSPSEHQFLSNYSTLLEDLRGAFMEVDLGASLVPPKDLFVEVRVLKDIGEVVMESGSIVSLFWVYPGDGKAALNDLVSLKGVHHFLRLVAKQDNVSEAFTQKSFLYRVVNQVPEGLEESFDVHHDYWLAVD
ncbi:DNA replication protein psf1 [Dinochytrium kinnereticum]|nr:DNA replication protein psf1 [Dinochytrium kinnereticum]